MFHFDYITLRRGGVVFENNHGGGHECQLFYNRSYGIIPFIKKYTDIFKMNEINWYTTGNNGPAF